MAARKSSAGAVGTWVGVAVAIIGLYLTYKWLSRPRATSSLPGGFVGGSYGGGSVSPYGASNGSGSTALNNFLKGLQSLLNGKKSGGSGVSFGTGGGSGSGARDSISSSLRDQIAAISGFSTIANNTPLPELGGYSLENYDPGAFDQSLIAGLSIPDGGTFPVPGYSSSPALFDLSGMAFDPSGLGGDQIPLDYGSGLDGLSIPYIDPNSFLVTSDIYDPSGDLGGS